MPQIVSYSDVEGTRKQRVIPGGHYSWRTDFLTPYGPMVANEKGLGFISLYARRDSGAHDLPECVDELMGIDGRKPWQISEMPTFDSTAESYMHAFSRIPIVSSSRRGSAAIEGWRAGAPCSKIELWE